MARTALYAPAHRVMGRVSIGAGGAAQPPTIGPSADAVFNGVQDARLQWKAGYSTVAPEVIMWPDLGVYPSVDYVPSTASTVAIAALQTPTVNVPLTLVTTSGAGINVSTTPTLMFPSMLSVPTGACFIDGLPVYRMFGYGKQLSGAYDGTTMMSRAVTVHSAGNDSTATVTVTGYDMYGYLTHQTMTMANIGNVTTLKAFKAVTSIVCAGTLSGSQVSVGQADVFGLPFFCNALSALEGFWNNTQHYSLGTLVNGVTTSPSTFLLGDVRGTWVPPSASNNAIRWTLYMHPSLAQLISAGINIGMFGVPQV